MILLLPESRLLLSLLIKLSHLNCYYVFIIIVVSGFTLIITAIFSSTFTECFKFYLKSAMWGVMLYDNSREEILQERQLVYEKMPLPVRVLDQPSWPHCTTCGKGENKKWSCIIIVYLGSDEYSSAKCLWSIWVWRHILVDHRVYWRSWLSSPP